MSEHWAFLLKREKRTEYSTTSTNPYTYMMYIFISNNDIDLIIIINIIYNDGIQITKHSCWVRDLRWISVIAMSERGVEMIIFLLADNNQI